MNEIDGPVFRFPLPARGAEAPPEEEPLVELVRDLLLELLAVATPMCDGREVRIDGFRLHCHRKLVIPLGRVPPPAE